MLSLAVWLLAMPSGAQEEGEPAGVGAAWSADLPVASDGRHLWLVLPTRNDKKLEATRLMHADLALDEPVWESVTQTLGRTNPRSIAAEGGRLWLFYDGGTVEVLGLRPAPIEGDWFFSVRQEPTLPAGLTVRAAAARGDEAWVLVRGEDQPTLHQLDQLGSSAEAKREYNEALNIALGLPRPLGAEASAKHDPTPGDAIEAPPTEPQEDAPAPESQTDQTQSKAATTDDTEPGADADADADVPTLQTPADRLLYLSRQGWRNVPLPEAWRHGDTVSILPSRDGVVGGVTLLAARRSGERSHLDRYRWRGDDAAWSASALALPDRGDWVGMTLNGQDVVAREVASTQGLAVRVSAARGEQWIDIGELTPGEHDGGRWAAVPVGDAVGAVAGPRDFAKAFLADPIVPDAAALTIAAVDLHGKPTGDPKTPAIEEVNPIADAADQIILLTVVITSTVLLFSFWRRDPTVNELALPDGVVVADLLRRVLAGLIDLTPGVMVAMTLFSLEAGDVYDRWPGRGTGATWSLMLPGITAIATVVLHTAILEALTGRSLGKMLTGLRVMTLAGGRPRLWQIAVRCALKAFDLVAYLLLVLPLVSPYRQRLGDMVARTVVVMKAPKADNEDNA